jgi:hypothetical protein
MVVVNPYPPLGFLQISRQFNISNYCSIFLKVIVQCHHYRHQIGFNCPLNTQTHKLLYMCVCVCVWGDFEMFSCDLEQSTLRNLRLPTHTSQASRNALSCTQTTYPVLYQYHNVSQISDEKFIHNLRWIIESKRLWRWCMALRITEVLDLVHLRDI